MADDLRIVRGAPTAEELAAIVGVLLLPARVASAEAERTSRWALSARPGIVHRDGRPGRPGPRAWRTSALPR